MAGKKNSTKSNSKEENRNNKAETKRRKHCQYILFSSFSLLTSACKKQ